MSQRGLSAAMLTAIASQAAEYFLLVSIGFDGGTEYITTHSDDISWNSHTWSASNLLKDIGEIAEDVDLNTSTIRLTFSGANQAEISNALSEDYSDRPVEVYLGVFDASRAVITDPNPIFIGRLDHPEISEDVPRGTSTLTWIVTNHFADFDHANGRFANDSSHQALYSGDTFFEYITEIQKTIVWGLHYASPNYPYPGGGGTVLGIKSGPILPQAQPELTKITATLSAQKIPVVYGTRQVEGILTYVGTADADESKLYVVLTLSEGECDGIDELLVDDVAYDDSSYGGNISYTFHSGTSSQAVDAGLSAAVSDWDSGHQGKDTCYIVILLNYDPDIFSGLPTFKVTLRGIKLYDTRTSTTAFDNNNALVVYDYLTNTRYGKGLSSGGIGGVDDAADYCETTQASAPVSQDMFQCDAIIDTSQTMLDNLKTLLASFRGMLPFTGGIYNLLIDKDETPSFTFDISNIRGKFSFGAAGIRDRFNRVEASFKNPNKNWEDDIGIQDSSAYRTADNGRLLKSQFDMPCTTNLYRAQDMSEFIMNQSRQQLRCDFQTIMAALEVEPGQVVYVTHETPGWTTKKFRVKSIRINPLAAPPLSFELTEHDSNVYTMTARSTEANAPDTNLPDARTVTAPTNLVLNSGSSYLVQGTDGTILSHIHLGWTATTDPYATRYEIQYKKSADSVWIDMRDANGVATNESLTPPVDDGVDYDVRIRAINSLGFHSSWLETDDHTVVGKTAPPADVSSITVTRLTNGTRLIKWVYGSPPVDLASFYIKVKLGTSLTWGDLQDLPGAEGLPGGSRAWETAQLAAGTYTFGIKARDTSGNLSDTAATVEVALGDPPLGTALAQVSGFDENWAATITDAHVEESGYLVADNADTWADLPSTWAAWTSWITNPATTIVYEFDTIDLGSIKSVTGYMTADTDSDATLEMNYSDDDATYSGWTSVGAFSGRYVKFRATIDQSASEVPVLRDTIAYVV